MTSRRLKQLSAFPISRYDQKRMFKCHAGQVGVNLGGVNDDEWRADKFINIDGVDCELLLQASAVGARGCTMLLLGRPDGGCLEVYRDGWPQRRI